ncbi:MAG TPA: choice-of-anchor tandem repeat GloVer-containing protein [Terriglobia bacterium]|nr:choice-of-anchor tandem repeat GloVer-containing protein [Terriglobia bacterium]
MNASLSRPDSVNRKPLGWRALVAALTFCAVAPIASRAQTLTTLYSFASSDGRYVEADLVQATDGNLYGTVAKGGPHGWGTVFKMTPAGTLTTLHDFDQTDGGYVTGTLIQGTDGNFYGTTIEGGTTDYGTVYKITPGGTLTTLYNFCSQSRCADGKYPSAGLVQAANGNLYGTTEEGGTIGAGTVFKITPGGSLTTLYNFCSQSGCTDGANPHGALIQARDGNFYGTTSGEDNGYGTVFKMTSGGTLTTLYSFCSQSGCTDGEHPFPGLIQASDGNLYGTTKEGGTGGGGTVFKITLSGALTTLYSFCAQSGCTDGEFPEGALVQGTDGKLYGTTYQGGTATARTAPPAVA